MIAAGGLEYALARMHARMGRRADEAAWRAIEQTRGVAPVAELVAHSTLAALAAPLLAAPDLHALDRAADVVWSRAVSDTAHWMPSEYVPAIEWCGPLPLLPALAHLALGAPAPGWLRAHPTLAALAAAPASGRAALLHETGLGPLAAAWTRPDALGDAWIAECRRRLPRASLSGTPLAELAALVARHLARTARAEAHESTPLREQFERALLRCFRRHVLDPAAAFAWLALTALDIRRLRGELARRIALPALEPVP